MNFAEYLEQFDWIQPCVVVCRSCGQEYMLVKGGMKAESMDMGIPRYCAYCADDMSVVKTPSGGVN